MPNDPAASPHRIERVLVVMAGTVIGLSALAFVAVLIGRGVGVDVQVYPWPVVLTVPLLGFPIGILLIVAFMIVVGVRRSREARDGG